MNDYHFRHFTIPAYMRQGIDDYVQYGVPPGSFLTAVICNNFKDAVMGADDNNMNNLPAYAAYVYNEMPMGSHGSVEVMEQWIMIRTEVMAGLRAEG